MCGVMLEGHGVLLNLVLPDLTLTDLEMLFCHQ